MIARKLDSSGGIGYTRFFQLIFTYLCPNANFDDDELLPVFQIAEKTIITNDISPGNRKPSNQACFPALVSIKNENRVT